MSYVKLDTGILDSSVWEDRDIRDIFITMLLMAKPHFLKEAEEAMNVRDLEDAGFLVPVGDYGLVEASSVGIISRSGLGKEAGLQALEVLSGPDQQSRSQEHDGRRVARINGGYVILNYTKYRDKDHTATERMRRYRERMAKQGKLAPVTRNVTQAEAEAEAEAEAKSITASSARVPCPSDLRLLEQQRQTLEASLVPGWAIDHLTATFAAKYAGDASEKRTLQQWRRGLVTAIQSSWNDPKRRPKKPETSAPDPAQVRERRLAREAKARERLAE